MSVTQDFVDRLTATSVATVGERIVDAAQSAVVDHLAAGLYGARQPWSGIVAEHALLTGQRGKVPLYGRPERCTAAIAARVNGTASHGFELDDFHEPSLVHPGSVVMPAGLSVAAERQVDGLKFLGAVIAGYEAMGRLGFAASAQASPWHTTGLHGTMAAAYTAAVCAGLPPPQIVTALGIAASFAGGLKAFQTGGGEVKRLHTGRAAENGIVAVELTEAGLTGPTDVLENPRGYFAAYHAAEPDPARLTDNWGERYIIDEIYCKPYAACAANHAAIEALKGILQRRAVEVDDVERIVIGSSGRGLAENSGIALTGTMSVQYSVEAAAALTLLGTVDNPSSFELDHYVGSEAFQLAGRVEVVFDKEVDAAYPRRMAARARLELRGGIAEEEFCPGLDAVTEPEARRAAAETKFRALTAGLLTTEQQEHVLRLALRLADGASPAALLDALS
ncbi:MAG: MmgE/PrpD family protein [Acidimicrobiaceae bacterium]|nr:MmgE/PrpD family protein [Acidimicrobiaceae bacterium]